MSDTEDDADGPVDNGDSTDVAGDADDGGFDKEAEREKLRKKYEKEEARRQATQQMSELLLKGATMTNAHCDSCGNPIFRYDGEEFCGSCGRTYGTDAEEPEQEGRQPDAGQQGTPETGRPQQGVPASEQPSQPGAGAQSDAGRDDVESSASEGVPDLEPERSLSPDPSELQASEDRDLRSSRSPPARGGTPSGRLPDRLEGADEPPSLSQTQASLRRAIVSLAEQAAQSDDPKRAKRLLEAAREGTEALDVLTPDE